MIGSFRWVKYLSIGNWIDSFLITYPGMVQGRLLSFIKVSPENLMKRLTTFYNVISKIFEFTTNKYLTI